MARPFYYLKGILNVYKYWDFLLYVYQVLSVGEMGLRLSSDKPESAATTHAVQHPLIF
jgi:hypothetical protein